MPSTRQKIIEKQDLRRLNDNSRKEPFRPVKHSLKENVRYGTIERDMKKELDKVDRVPNARHAVGTMV